ALVPLVEARREVTVLRERAVPGDAHGLAEYTSESPVMREFLSTARRVAHRDTTVLLLGETGVGKGLFVRALHNEGPRAEGPFVAVNGGAIPESLAESELFGHEKGAYTGAGQARRGRFELAHGGTLFLDEVSELPLSLQVKLLTVLEDRAVVPVGAERPVRVDVRVIAASNRDLAEEVRERRFRADLYYRLNVVSLTLPPLRDRPEDVPALVRSYVAHHAERLHADVRDVAPDAMAALVAHDWPGNVRELVNAVERAVLMADGPTLELEDLPPDVARAASPAAPPREEDGRSAAVLTDAVGGEERVRPWSEVRRLELDRLEARYLSDLLRACRGRINVAAERSGLDPRSLYDKLKRHGLRKEDYRGAAPTEE
ncbi:MAG: sigma-54 interaction domain-containing protein, partial [Planctomycetota bacterium JB042]